MQIVAGLNSGAIYRLKRTWELVNQRSMSTLTFLGNLMSPENNHALYRDALRLVGSPCVPFLGMRPVLASTIQNHTDTDCLHRCLFHGLGYERRSE